MQWSSSLNSSTVRLPTRYQDASHTAQGMSGHTHLLPQHTNLPGCSQYKTTLTSNAGLSKIIEPPAQFLTFAKPVQNIWDFQHATVVGHKEDLEYIENQLYLALVPRYIILNLVQETYWRSISHSLTSGTGIYCTFNSPN